MSEQKIQLIGMGVELRLLPSAYLNIIQKADVLVGGNRLLDLLENEPTQRITLKSPLADCFNKIKQCLQEEKQVVVVADGDPGFFGISRALIHEFGPNKVELFPNVTVSQVAAARIGKPWQEISTVSLHGRRDLFPLFQALAWNNLVGVYTDSWSSPNILAEKVLNRCGPRFKIHIFEDLGSAKENISSIGLKQAMKSNFSELNFVIFESLHEPEISLNLGLEDHHYLHEQGMITKKEIRVVGIGQLNIRPRETIWDLGAGCGSIAIEASLLAPEGRIFAIESKKDRAEQIRENIKRTGAYPVEVVQGYMPDCLSDLPNPGRVFIGGGCGKDLSVLKQVLAQIQTKGRIVIHTVLQGTLARITDFCQQQGLSYTYTTIQVCRSQVINDDTRLVPLNPIGIITIDT